MSEEGLDAPLVSIKALNHWFGKGAEARKQVLFDDTIDLMPGELVIMTGPSGSGKTTLLTLIGALRSVQDGSLRVMDRELRAMAPAELVKYRQGVGFIFQAHNLFAALSAYQNVRLALDLGEKSFEEKDALTTGILRRLGLGQRIDHKPQMLSGGQRQRVAIARALVGRPRLILADEPTAALDKESGREVVDILRERALEDRATILMVTHDSRILDVADRIVNMVDGRIVHDNVVRETVTICSFLRKVQLFEGQSAAGLNEIAERMRRERHPAGAKVIRQGEAGDKFYLIRRGRASVTVAEGSGSRPLASLGEGDFFGEAALLTGNPRSATVAADGPLEVFTLAKPDFEAAVRQCPTFEEQLKKVLFARS